MKALENLIFYKYQNSFLKENTLIKIYKKKKEILLSNFKLNLPNKKYKKKNYFDTQEYLVSLLKKKKLTKKEMRNIYLFYEKFSIHLSLKKSYKKNLTKKNNVKTNFTTYIFLAVLVLKLKKINHYQKLNFLLKVNDISLLNFKKLGNNEKYFFQKNLNSEFVLLKKCI
jgi:hypothetical protein